MKLVVGLGNPGEKYKNTRHNVGYWVVDKLVEARHSPGKTCKRFSTNDIHHSVIDRSLGNEELLIVKPQLFMNKSGVAVKKVLKKFQGPTLEDLTLEDLYVVHDDLDIKLGEYKISFGKGPKDHNGLKNIYEQIGTDKFWHVRVGVGGISPLKLARDQKSKRHSPLAAIGRSQGESGEEYVLSNWRPEEKKIVDKVIEKILKELKDVFD